MNSDDQKIKNSLKKRYRSEKMFKAAGFSSIAASIVFLFILFGAIIHQGYPAFVSHKISLPIDMTTIDQQNINYRQIIKESLNQRFPDAKTIIEKANLHHLISKIAPLELKNYLDQNPKLLNRKSTLWFTTSSDVDMYLKGKISENSSQLNSQQIAWIKILQSEHSIVTGFNSNFFKYADASEPEIAGIAASVVGSFLTVIVFLLAAIPIGIMSAFYLEEMAPKNIITDIIEVSINNLAAIPSIIFGLLGLVVYLNFMSLPRSSALVGGLTLSLMVLPIIIIATRSAIKTIPPTIKDAAFALGASKTQTMLHHTLPLALPGIMTGAILAISRALGETAPLLMIGMVAFIADVPKSFLDPTSALPVQIYLWSSSPELGFAEKSAAAIMILLLLLIFFNSIAVFIRKKFEKKW